MQTPSVPCRVLIVDDNAAFLQAAEQFIAHLPEVLLVGRAIDGPSALEAVSRLRPDVALVDIHMPGMNGFELAHRLQRVAEPPGVVLISSDVDGEALLEAERLGVAAVLPKQQLVAGLPDALRRACAAGPRACPAERRS